MQFTAAVVRVKLADNINHRSSECVIKKETPTQQNNKVHLYKKIFFVSFRAFPGGEKLSEKIAGNFIEK